GRTVAIEYRWAEGRNERLAEIAAEFVQRKVDVIVTHSAEPVIAAKKATSVIPIVIALAADPVGTGLVATLARPGGNVTGLSLQSTDLAGKRLALLREVVPGLRRLAIMVNPSAPARVLEMSEVEATAKTLGLDIATFEIRRAEDFAPAFAAFKGWRSDWSFCASWCPARPAWLSSSIQLKLRIRRSHCATWTRLLAVSGCRSRSSKPIPTMRSAPRSKAWGENGPRRCSSGSPLSSPPAVSNWSNWRRSTGSPQYIHCVILPKPVD